MSCAKGDYIGFTIGDYHSTQLGIVRVSSGDRYTQNILPTITDKTVQVPGADGTFLFGSFYTQNTIHIDFAFDSATDSQLRLMSQVFGIKKPQKLIFDENPYKYYMVKSSGTPQLKYLTFDEYDSSNNLYRAYKGEGSIDLIAYYPYAKQRYKYLDEYKLGTWSGTEWTDNTVPEWIPESSSQGSIYVNKDEWAAASGLLSTQGDYDAFVVTGSSSQLQLYNAGDMETDFKLSIPFDSDGNISTTSIFLGIDGESAENILNLNDITKKDTNDTRIIINSASNLIEGYNVNTRTGSIYNDAVDSGFFFKIPRGTERFTVTNITDSNLSLEYNYLYY